MQIRPAAVAGSFYPADPDRLRSQLSEYLAPVTSLVRRPRALVVPHAGYIYSGRVAGAAYSSLLAWPPLYRRVLLVGPAHRVPLQGCALPDCQALATPLGQLPIDQPLYERARHLNHVVISEVAHRLEHSLEVQLPFLQQCLPEVALLPLLIGQGNAPEVAALLDCLWQPDLLLVVSSDLSHFHPYAEARAKDAATCAKILAFDHRLAGDEACGCRALNGFLLLARARGLEGQLLSACNSGDTAGARDRVVGYGAFAFH